MDTNAHNGKRLDPRTVGLSEDASNPMVNARQEAAFLGRLVRGVGPRRRGALRVVSLAACGAIALTAVTGLVSLVGMCLEECGSSIIIPVAVGGPFFLLLALVGIKGIWINLRQR